MNESTNNYNFLPFEIIHQSNVSNKFGVQITFERNSEGTNGILINYHLLCAMFVFVASINFLIDPKVVPGRAGMLVTLFLVLTNFFSNAQVIPRAKEISIIPTFCWKNNSSRLITVIVLQVLLIT